MNWHQPPSRCHSKRPLSPVPTGLFLVTSLRSATAPRSARPAAAKSFQFGPAPTTPTWCRTYGDLIPGSAPSVAIYLPEQVRQPRNVDCDPSRLVIREHLCLFARCRVDHIFIVGADLFMQAPGSVREKTALMHGAPLHRHAIPNGGNRTLKPRAAIDDEELARTPSDKHLRWSRRDLSAKRYVSSGPTASTCRPAWRMRPSARWSSSAPRLRARRSSSASSTACARAPNPGGNYSKGSPCRSATRFSVVNFFLASLTKSAGSPHAASLARSTGGRKAVTRRAFYEPCLQAPTLERA
jgi:hypothetical protein